MAIKTKEFTSDMLGAPALAGQAGAFIALLDVCLVNGFGTVNVVSLSVEDEVATMTFAMGHSFKKDTVALIAGGSEATLNGQHRIIEIATNVAKFAAPGVANITPTGSITAKVAPAGWTKVFSDTNKAAYKSNDPESTGMLLRVDDTTARFAKVRGFEAMTDVDTGTGPFPTTAQFADAGLWWSKSSTADGTAKAWRLVADSRALYWMPQPELAASYGKQGFFFGDFINIKTNDPYACMLRGNYQDRSSANGGYGDDLGYNDLTLAYDGAYVPRASTALGSAVRVATGMGMGPGVNGNFALGSSGLPFPGVDNGLTLVDLFVWNYANGLRGTMPGLYVSPQIVNTQFTDGDVIDGTGFMAGKQVKVMGLHASVSSVPTYSARLFMDMTTDWRT